jgi:hypothetical protein
MNTSAFPRWLWCALLLALSGAACLDEAGTRGKAPSQEAPPPQQPEAKKKALAKNVFFEIQGDKRRVIVNAVVCLREGFLEGLLCRKQTKEHEYILAADCDALFIHGALIAAKAKPGAPVQFQPEYRPATGTPIKVLLRYVKDGKEMTVPAQQWIRDMKTKKDLNSDWVFGGSKLLSDPEDKTRPPFYLANQGDVICVCNMDTAMLDLPIKSTKSIDFRLFEANSDRIPALGTPVEIILEPILESKAKKP